MIVGLSFCGKDKLKMILSDKSPDVKRVVVAYLSDYGHESIEEAGRGPVTTS
jgi:hypothetical protein